jgi:hypothetical protein
LFASRVEFLFYAALAILKQNQSALVAMDLSKTLQAVGQLGNGIDIAELIKDALFFAQHTPSSFLQ